MADKIIGLDLSKRDGFNKAITGRVGDKNNTYLFRLFNNGVLFDLTKATQIALLGLTPTGYYVDAVGFPQADGTIKVDIPSSFNAEVGYFQRCFIRVVTTDEEILSTQDLIYYSYGNADISVGGGQDYIGRVEELIKEINEAADNFTTGLTDKYNKALTDLQELTGKMDSLDARMDALESGGALMKTEADMRYMGIKGGITTEDLNTVRGIGTYGLKNASGENRPNNAKYGSLLVLGDTAGQGVLQMFIDGSVTMFRKLNGTTWGAWVTLGNAADFYTKTEVDTKIANIKPTLATQEEAELGEDNTNTMTPLRTDQYFKAHLATQEEAENGVSHLKTMTPKRTAEQTLARFGQSFTPSTKFIAHRGNNYFYPENSIAAFEKTSRHWGAETDIQLTTDGKWYCFHDRTLDRMTNGTGNFMDKTSSEIEALRLDTGNGINTLSDVEKKIPTFEQYLNACIKARIVPVIEITPLKTDFTDAQLDSIVTVIRRKGLLNKCVIICFTYEVLVKMRQRMPYTVMHWLISEYSEEMIQKCVINNFVPSFDYSKASVNQALIDKIHDAGLECGLWTVPYNNHQKYSDMGVDYITTDSASGNLRYFEPALRSGMTANKTDLTGPTYIEEMSNGEIHIRVNVTGGQNDVGVYICALESWAIPRHSLTLIGYVRSTKVTGFSFVPVAVGVGGYSAQDASTADPNIKFGYLCTGTNWEQRSSYAAFDLFYRI